MAAWAWPLAAAWDPCQAWAAWAVCRWAAAWAAAAGVQGLVGLLPIPATDPTAGRLATRAVSKHWSTSGCRPSSTRISTPPTGCVRPSRAWASSLMILLARGASAATAVRREGLAVDGPRLVAVGQLLGWEEVAGQPLAWAAGLVAVWAAVEAAAALVVPPWAAAAWVVSQTAPTARGTAHHVAVIPRAVHALGGALHRAAHQVATVVEAASRGGVVAAAAAFRARRLAGEASPAHRHAAALTTARARRQVRRVRPQVHIPAVVVVRRTACSSRSSHRRTRRDDMLWMGIWHRSRRHRTRHRARRDGTHSTGIRRSSRRPFRGAATMRVAAAAAAALGG